MVKPQLIAEIGWNHMGNMALAEQMISSAASSGADYAKFQTWSTKRLKSGPWDTDGRVDIYKSAELSIEDHNLLIDKCKHHGINFLSSAFSVEDATILNQLGVDSIKVASFEITNIPLLEYIASNFNTVFLSTGASTIAEASTAVSILKDTKLCIMHCVSSYPCEVSSINLPRINSLKEIHHRVGFSDHTSGVLVSMAACEYSPYVIEKHFTIDHSLPGRDNKFAILPDELLQLSQYLDTRELANASQGDSFQDSEIEVRNLYRGRFNG